MAALTNKWATCIYIRRWMDILEKHLTPKTKITHYTSHCLCALIIFIIIIILDEFQKKNNKPTVHHVGDHTQFLICCTYAGKTVSRMRFRLWSCLNIIKIIIKCEARLNYNYHVKLLNMYINLPSVWVCRSPQRKKYCRGPILAYWPRKLSAHEFVLKRKKNKKK